MPPALSLIFDVVMLVALAATIRFSLRLSRQFDRMQADRKVFDQMIQALNLASAKAEAATRSLKEAAVQSGDKLQEKINGARSLSEELEIMIQAGDSLAERLGVIAEKSRKATMAEATPAPPRSRAEKELLEAIKAKQS